MRRTASVLSRDAAGTMRCPSKADFTSTTDVSDNEQRSLQRFSLRGVHEATMSEKDLVV